MAQNGKDAVSFDDIIQAERKKKSQSLAQQMFGAGRRANGLSGRAARENNAGGLGASLASRVGVTKRSSSAGPKPGINGPWKHDLHSPGNNPRFGSNSKVSGARRGEALSASKHIPQFLNSSAPSTPNGQVAGQSLATGASMSIRGMARGPYVVVASNFALGTTAADIEAAVAPVGGKIESCRLITSSPTVMAEIVFTDREGAENVIATYNNQKADGKLLYVYLKPGGPSPIVTDPVRAISPPTEPRSAPPRPTVADDEQDTMDIDDSAANNERSRNYGPREKPPNHEYDNRRGTQPNYQNGRYGFRDPYQGPARSDYGRERRGRGLYSDDMYRGGQRYRP